MPGGGELSATLRLEYETPAERNRRLLAVLGLDLHPWRHAGDSVPVAAVCDGTQVSPTRISSVQHVGWVPGETRQQLPADGGAPVRIVIDHPHYRAQAVLGEETRRGIARDLE